MKEHIINVLHSFCNASNQLIAAFISGSTAFGRDDGFSDIDLRLVADEKEFNQIFIGLEHFLNSSIGLQECYIPKFSHYAQRFYKLKKFSKFNMIDVVLIKEQDLSIFLDKNRMGQAPLILCDRLNIIQPIETAKELYKKFEERIEDLQQQFFFLSSILVERAIKRNRYTEAVYFYNSRIIAPLIEILRYKYSPARQDFGLRYLQYDLPKDIVSKIDNLHQISSFEDIKNKLNIAEKLFRDTLDSLRHPKQK